MDNEQKEISLNLHNFAYHEIESEIEKLIIKRNESQMPPSNYVIIIFDKYNFSCHRNRNLKLQTSSRNKSNFRKFNFQLYRQNCIEMFGLPCYKIRNLKFLLTYLRQWKLRKYVFRSLKPTKTEYFLHLCMLHACCTFLHF